MEQIIFWEDRQRYCTTKGIMHSDGNEARSRRVERGGERQMARHEKKWMDQEQKNNGMIRQKAKVKWIMEGDENTRYFHAAMKNRERKNWIRGMTISKIWVEDLERIKAHVGAVAFSASGLVTSGGSSPSLLTPCATINSTVKNSTVFVCIAFAVLISGSEASCLRSCLCFQLVAFSEGGIQLVVDYISNIKTSSLIFKVGFEKAYDSVNWGCLLDTMKGMGFGRKWIGWIEACFRSSSISVVVNGAPTTEFAKSKGLRQGNPMAPFLFLIVAENLHLMMVDAIDRGFYEGIKVGQFDTLVSYHQFADDAIFFLENGA
ncbi:hypothetical protein OSB04_029984 [Centaurea solstitialis]|uniref:Reverse transcriptase domain-containing protein n=1 Tax=Centaurea solstitialis TaxID=347529 RepID=A0AA38SIZ0_9ASTR|nr:hypothetical protein OSB04_029984 [Centaurea solstitialis]